MNERDIDIVARLRAVLHYDRGVELMNREAADEIERLRGELVSTANRLTEERDQARRMVCEMCEANGDFAAERQAAMRGWDCFKEAAS